MASCVSLVNGGIFDFAEMWGFSPFGLYCHETVQSIRRSMNRHSAKCVQIKKKYFAVL